MSSPYLHTISPKETDEQLVSLRALATKEDIPIITTDGIRFLSQMVRLSGAKTILEIGTAIGYSSIYLAKHHDVHVTTIERDLDMIELARTHINDSGVSERIRLIQDDALLVDPTTLGPFDVIFIDAAKAQSIHLFQKYQSRLTPKGIILADNLLFHGLHEQSNLSRPLSQLVRKIDAFNQYVVTQEHFDTTIYPIGDGMSLSIRKDVIE